MNCGESTSNASDINSRVSFSILSECTAYNFLKKYHDKSPVREMNAFVRVCVDVIMWGYTVQHQGVPTKISDLMMKMVKLRAAMKPKNLAELCVLVQPTL